MPIALTWIVCPSPQWSLGLTSWPGHTPLWSLKWKIGQKTGAGIVGERATVQRVTAAGPPRQIQPDQNGNRVCFPPDPSEPV